MFQHTEVSSHTTSPDVSFRTRIMRCSDSPYREFVIFEAQLDGERGLRFLLYMDRADLPQLRDRLLAGAADITALIGPETDEEEAQP